jgi:hypothetical protein
MDWIPASAGMTVQKVKIAPNRGGREKGGRHEGGSRTAPTTQNVARGTQNELEVVIEVFGLAVVAVVNSGIFGVRTDADTLDSLGLFRIAVDCG